MSTIEDAIQKIKMLQCPTGELEDRVTCILEDCNVSPKSDIVINREERLDRDGAKAYSVIIADRIDPAMTLLAKSGQDDYVVQVEDVYFN